MNINPINSLFFLCSFIVLSCQNQKEVAINKPNETTKDKNNKVIVNSKNASLNGTSNDQIIFKGENNLVEINNQNTNFDNKNSNDVLIIEGNQNNISIDQSHTTYKSNNSQDTILVKGDRARFDFKARTSNSDSLRNSHIEDIAEYEDDETPEKYLVYEGQLMYVPEIDTLLTSQEALEYYKSQFAKKDYFACYKTGTFYEFGIGVPINLKIAMDYYETAARNEVVEAQFRLGELFETGKDSIEKNIEKARYYFTLAAKQGNDYAISRLNELH